MITPFEQPLRDKTFHDVDQHAASWRLFAAQIDATNQYKDFEGFAVELNNNWVKYSNTKHKERLDRFNLTRNITTAVNLNDFDNYSLALNHRTNQNVVAKLNNLITHLSDEFSVSRELLAGITVGRIHTTHNLKTRVLQDCMSLLGASQIVSEIPHPNLAGQWKPSKFGKEGGYRKSGRSKRGRRKSKKGYHPY